MARREGRILVVEDVPDILDFYASMLESQGFEVARAREGLTGLAMARVTRPDLVILNYQMPFVSGLEVLVELRADRRTADMKVIMTSAFPFIPRLASRWGADALVVPFSPRRLFQRVEYALATG